ASLGQSNNNDGPQPEPGTQSPESFAKSLLDGGSPLTREQILRLFERLPREEPPRKPDDDRQCSSFTTGAYCKGSLVGLRHNTVALPFATTVLTKYLQQLAPGFLASAISIFENVRTPVHRDARNAHQPNLVAPLSAFTGGQIWQEQEGGDAWEDTPDGARPGTLLEVCHGPITFEAWRVYHATRPWSGRRVVLVAYVTDKTDTLDPPDIERLLSLGFLLPTTNKAGSAETSEAIATQAHGPKEPVADQPVQFKPEACGNRGQPIQVEWEGQCADITDGFGLCSPSRWRPMDRGHRLSPQATAHAQSMYRMVTQFITEHVPDPKHLCMSILSGKLEASPFAGEKIQGLRASWAELLGAGQGDDILEIPEAQPFLLKALSRTAERLCDPDWEILTEGTDCFCTGEKLGRMVPTTMGALRAEYEEDMIRVASMGAIAKPDGSVRPLHDGTHGVQVNNHIHLVNQLAVPGPAEMAFSVRQSGAMLEVPLAVTADVSAAHRLVLHRLYGIIGRVVARCLLQHAFFHFAYVDDVHPTFYGRRMYTNFLVWLILQEMIGVPFAYHKFKGKTLVAFIGYELDYGSKLIGLSEARGAWVKGSRKRAARALLCQ
ncbi:unnamed protein product, partial [Symbiodinium sp. CCMP2456]